MSKTNCGKARRRRRNRNLTEITRVIVMSGHETIRVLEVEVDAALSSSGADGKLGAGGEEVADPTLEPAEGRTQDSPVASSTAASVSTEAVQTVAAPISVSLPQPQTTMPITVQTCPQVLTQDGLATLMTGMMAQQGSLGQPLLIPISMAGSVGGQSGLAVLTFPAATVATLPGLAAAGQAGSLIKLPFAGLQAATVLNSVQPQLQTPAQTLLQTQAAPGGAAQVPATPASHKAPEPSVSVATLQTAGLTINPAIISAASLGAQPQFISSLTTTPIITSAMSNVAGLTSQIITNAQGQGPMVTVAQTPVVIAPQPSAGKTTSAVSTAVPIACAEMPTVGQLVSKPQSGVSEEEGINLEEIREFAKNFKIRRLSLGLTQTQVGQALTATEGPAYSQSAICRFEKLDITPKSAQKLKPVLERWLAEAELWNQKGQQNLMEFVGGEPSKKRKRRTSFTPQAIEALNTYFEKNALPTGQEITEIAKELNYDREVVRVWFCNRRQTLKNTSKINVFQVQ
ncbi:POU domain, class 6, transcription factor 1 isoform X4 [Electrophorus electricus]|uniref:POU domain, class 6, transcription factor 1 isoform X4 n=1 Tax=Electrophorus electricus TaxID=8005 RepID=UPI0015D06A3F|nr:POU domain, class 6, transcription factor 1 isoform X4 [Electrophorus electricus]